MSEYEESITIPDKKWITETKSIAGIKTEHFIFDLISRDFKKNLSHKHENVDDSMVLMPNNGVALPEDLTDKLNWKLGDELYADIFDEELKQIVIGKKLEREDAVKALDKISQLLND